MKNEKKFLPVKLFNEETCTLNPVKYYAGKTNTLPEVTKFKQEKTNTIK